jgi:cyclase
MPISVSALRTFAFVMLLALAGPVLAQQDLSAVEIETIPLADGVFMLVGAGGNVGLQVGGDGALLIDTQYAPLTERLRAAVAAQTDQPVRLVVNTHWHGDHTGGNEDWAGAGAVLIAHENVRQRMSTDQFMEALGRTVPASPAAARPALTFTDGMTLHWNGGEVRIFHLPYAHTDGDAIVHFASADVIHAGDLYFNGAYPFIDTSSGGTLAGMIAATDTLLAIAGPETRIIPGHGPLSGRAELETYRDLLLTARERIGALMESGLSREDVIAAGPMREYDAAWGRGFMQPDQWVGIVYDAMRASRP